MIKRKTAPERGFIAVSSETKRLFDHAKKNLTSDAFIVHMLDFFVINKIDPATTDSLLSIEVIKRVEYSIKVSKGIEKSTVERLDRMSTMIEAIGSIVQTKEDIEPFIKDVTKGDIRTISIENEKLKAMIDQLRKQMVSSVSSTPQTYITSPSIDKKYYIDKCKELVKYVGDVLLMDKFNQKNDNIIRLPIHNYNLLMNSLNSLINEI